MLEQYAKSTCNSQYKRHSRASHSYRLSSTLPDSYSIIEHITHPHRGKTQPYDHIVFILGLKVSRGVYNIAFSVSPYTFRSQTSLSLSKCFYNYIRCTSLLQEALSFSWKSISSFYKFTPLISHSLRGVLPLNSENQNQLKDIIIVLHKLNR